MNILIYTKLNIFVLIIAFKRYIKKKRKQYASIRNLDGHFSPPHGSVGRTINDNSLQTCNGYND